MADRGIGLPRQGGRSTYISELERGKKGASIKMLFRLAPLLDASPAQILALVEAEVTSSSR
jgi:transcriptional regulator with XRE-family HTH domain